MRPDDLQEIFHRTSAQNHMIQIQDSDHIGQDRCQIVAQPPDQCNGFLLALPCILCQLLIGIPIRLFQCSSGYKRSQTVALAAETGGNVSGNAEIAESCDFIFLGVKPQMMGDMLAGIKDILASRKEKFILVTMAAGLEIKTIREMAGGDYPVIRIMPNTPVAVGEGMTLYACSENVDGENEKVFLDAFKFSGKLDKLPEELIDAGCAVSGCGPAFVYQFIEALADGGVRYGVPRTMAYELAAQTLIGASRMVLETGEHPGKLKDAVCSPGGTTIEGVYALEKGGMRAAVMDALGSTIEKTMKLSK